MEAQEMLLVLLRRGIGVTRATGLTTGLRGDLGLVVPALLESASFAIYEIGFVTFVTPLALAYWSECCEGHLRIVLREEHSK